MALVHPARAPPSDTASGTAIFSGHGDSTTGVAGDAIAGSGTGGTTNAQAARKTIAKPPSVEQFPTDADEGAESIPVQRSDAGQDDAARISLHAADTQGGNLPAATRLWGLLYTCQAALGVAVTLALCLEWCNGPADTADTNHSGQLGRRRGAVQGLVATQAALAAGGWGVLLRLCRLPLKAKVARRNWLGRSVLLALLCACAGLAALLVEGGGSACAGEQGVGFWCAAAATVIGVASAAVARATSNKLGTRKRSPTDQLLRKMSSDRALEIEQYREEERGRVALEKEQRRMADT